MIIYKYDSNIITCKSLKSRAEVDFLQGYNEFYPSTFHLRVDETGYKNTKYLKNHGYYQGDVIKIQSEAVEGEN